MQQKDIAAISLPEYNAMVDRAQTYAEAYYLHDQSLIPDTEYDQLTEAIKAVEALHPAWARKDSPNQSVMGAAAEGMTKVKHREPLNSLNDVFTIDDVIKWWRNLGRPELCIEEKVDGLTMTGTYVNGQLTLAATRGDGEYGEDVTQTAMRIPSVPKKINTDPETVLYVRGEVYLPFAAFDAINEDLASKGKPQLANARNAASGILRSQNSPYADKLHWRVFQLISAENMPADCSEFRQVVFLGMMGFETVTCAKLYNETDIVAGISQIDMRRRDPAGDPRAYPFPTDGAALKVDDKTKQAAIPGTDKYPGWAVAYKYPAEEKTTTIRAIELTTGRTGVIAPTAVFDPISLAGTTVSRATLHNQRFIDDMGLGIGAEIRVIKSGEIIPKVTGVVKRAPSPFRITACPSCGAPAVQFTDENGNSDTVIMGCPNANGCPAQLSSYLEYFASKHIMDIRGLGPKNIQKLLDAGLIASPTDLYGLTVDTLTQKAKMTEKTAAKLVDAIMASKKQPLDRVFAALAIPGCGRTVGKALAEHFPDMKAISNASMDELQLVPGIGEISASAIYAHFNHPSAPSPWLAWSVLGINMKSDAYGDPEPRPNTSAELQPLADSNFVVTGTIPGYTRESITDYLRSLGANVASAVSRQTDYVLTDDPNGSSSKLKKARASGVAIITPQELREMIWRRRGQIS